MIYRVLIGGSRNFKYYAYFKKCVDYYLYDFQDIVQELT